MPKKIVWFSVYWNEIMKEDFNRFVADIKPFTEKIETYVVNPPTFYLKIETTKEKWSNSVLQHMLSGWVFYHPINALQYKPPKVSDYDLQEVL